MKNPNFLSKIFLLFLFCITSYFSAFAIDYSNSTYIQNLSLDKSTKKLSFTVVIYDDLSIDQFLEYATFTVNGENYLESRLWYWYVNQGFEVNNPFSIGSNPAADYIQSTDGSGDRRFYHQFLSGEAISISTIQTGTEYKLDVEMDLKPSQWYAQNYTVSTTNNFRILINNPAGVGQVYRAAPTYIPTSTIPGWESISINSFTATNNSCNTVDLNWGLTSGEINDVYYEVKADGSTIFTGTGSNSVVDFLSNPQPIGINYALKAGYGTGYKFPVNSTTIGGPPRTDFDIPTAFSATNHRCDEIELTWTKGANTSGVEEYLITRLIDNAEFTTDSSNNSYTIFNNGLGGALQAQDYAFKIEAVSKCGFKSPGVANATSLQETLTGASNLIITELSSGSIELNWTDGIGETEYEIIKNPTNSATNPILAKDSTRYVDNNVDPCTQYSYIIKSRNNCVPNGFVIPAQTYTVTPNLSNTFLSQQFSASKGYEADKVHLEWAVDNNSTIIEKYVISRKILNAVGNYTPLEEIDGNTINTYDDLSAVSGVLYEYKIYAQITCNNIIQKSDSIISVGFRSAFGTVSGQVNYTGGIAVEDVKISAESTTGNVGSSLSFNGNGYAAIADGNYNANELSIELWLKPDAVNTNDFTLFEKNGQYSFKRIGTNYVFNLTSVGTVQFPSNLISATQFSQITTTVTSDSIKLFVNGLQKASLPIGGTIALGTDSLKIGENYIGLLDEFRLWDIGKSNKTVLRDFSRQMGGAESNLKIYLKMNENLGAFAYDFSKQSNIAFNKNHAKMNGGITWSSTVPPANQLKLATYTDNMGNYVLSIPFSGSGEVFTITPSYLTHNFSPGTRAISIGVGSFIQNNIDFEDISSFKVQGSLFYANTSCAVENATLKVDGNIVVQNGLPIKTDAQGNYLIQVPIGEHYITIEKTGHIMNVGRFPEFGTYDFQDDKAGVNFKDTTLVRVVGRVVGGLREAQYLPMNGRSKNNIGQAQIILKSQQGNGCFTDTILTIDSTGEYSSYLPPLRYVPTVDILSNPTIDFGVLDLVDLTNATNLITKTDSFFNNNNNLYSVDSVSFNKQLDYIYRVTPVIIVKETNLVNDFRGDTIYEYSHPNGSMITRDLRINPLPWPVFNGIEENREYTCLITAYEAYQNYDAGTPPKQDTVPVTDGTVVFNNELCISPGGQVELSDINTLNELNYIYYKFELGSPNFNENINIPEYSYVKKFELNILFPDGSSIPWKPNVYNGTFSGQFVNVYDKIFRGYLLGAQKNGDQFVTAGPQIPEYILRDPPGSNSSATREVGSTTTTENSWSWSSGGSVSSVDKLFLGAKITTGLLLSTETNVENNNIVGFSAEISGGNSGSESVTITNTDEWSTNSSTDLPGKGSDLYIGKSKNITFGITKTLKIVPDSLCTQVECIGSSLDSLTLSNAYGLFVVPGGYETQFIYNEDHIKTYLIPELIQLRNAILQTPGSKYTSHYSITDPRYGLNNDDPRVNSIYPFTPEEQIEYILQTPDSSYTQFVATYGNEMHWTSSKAQKAKWDYYNRYQHPDSSYLSGYSYTYNAVNLQDSLTGDSVRWVNNQIKHWEEAIMLNEWEKVNIDEPAIRTKMKEIELTKLYAKYYESLAAYVALAASGGVVAGVGSLTSLLIPLPGAAVVGSVTFAATTATEIASSEIYEEFLQYGTQRQSIIVKYNTTNANYSVSGGSSFTNTMTHEIASSYNNKIEYGMETNIAFELSNKVSNTGIGFTKNLSFNYNSSKNWSESTSNSETVSFNLNEPDQGDYFSVDVFPSLLGWGPVFKLRAGGRTSCPHEDAQLTEYYTEDPLNPSTGEYAPFYPLGEKTLQRDKPTISAAPTLLTNIPTTNAAAFNLTINNESESNDPREYRVALHSPSNPFGAIVKIDGTSPNTLLAIPPLSSINKVVTISKGPGPVYNYDSILMLVYAPCQYAAGTSDNVDIVDSVYISAHFLPTCTDVSFATPDDLWVLNNNFNDTMPVAVIDYDINFYDFNSIRLDYKPSSQSQWTGLQTFYRDTAGLNNSMALEIPTSLPFTLWDWETDQLVDGNYDLRLVTQCTLADKISPTHTGVMDRINPHPFGTPSPADGILDPNDDIYIKFNEPVELGSLTSLNFDVRGVINGSETTHASNLAFDGVNDYVEVTGGANLQNRDFTIEFSVKRNGLGEEAIITQGTDANDQFYVGFDATNHLEFKINGTTLTSFNIYTDNNWHYFAVAYDFENETADMYEASATSTASIINPGGNSIYEKYIGNDKLIIGKDASSTTNFFNGNIDDVRIWNVTRSLNEFSLTKSILLSSNQLGLLYNWRFDDANGIIAEDHVRARNATLNDATWTIEPGGNAVVFSAVDSNYLKIQKGTVNITEGMDFTLEFWFNSSQAGPATLVSNGKADGINADSLYSWNINKDGAGNIHVLHNGIDFLATDSNYFDGEWHHFALVLNRLASLTSYVDGNLQHSMPATSIRELGAPSLYLGARGYLVGATETIDNYFDGQMDEFRFWDASRKYEQIARDQHNRMKGDEFALRLYLPFEDYQLDPTGVAILTPSFDEQIDLSDTVNVVANPNSAILNALGPKIKLQRPIEVIAHTYSVNGDEIIITTTTNPALIENVTLDVTVKNVKDLHGNVMESPKTWIAYMDKNQVIWQDDQFTFYKNYGDALNFSTQVVNSGGAAKDFDLENIPTWLSADIISGTIAPNSAITVNFEVDPLINIGDYTQDIHLLTDFGFPEKLAINLTVREQEPNWQVDPTDFDYSMNVIGYLKIKNIVSNSDEDILAAFVDGECRGKAHLEYVPLIDRYLVFLDIYSDTTNYENVSFQIWDASTGVRYSDVTPNIIPFVENTLVGTISNPQLFETNYEVIVDIPLVTGWNWVSNFLNNKDSLNIDKTLESIEAVQDNLIKGKGAVEGVAKFEMNNNAWEGTLNNIGIRPENGYKLQVSQTDTLVLKGDILNPITRKVNLKTNWNWIGFISLRNQSVKEALGNLNAVDGDLIKAQSQFAVYDPILGWIGSLQTMIPGQGYMYKSINDKTFVYPFAGKFKSGLISDSKTYKNKIWTVDYGKYSSNMTTIAQVETDCEDLINDGDYAIGVFDNKDICRGVSQIKLNENQGLSFLTSSGNELENLNLRIVNNANNDVYNLDANIAYQPNTHLGNIKNPYGIKITEEVCKKIAIADDEIVVNLFTVYPSEIDQKLTLEYFAVADDYNSEIIILNLLGQTVFSYNAEIEKGKNKVDINVSKLNLSKGIYHLNFKSGDTSETIKLISK